MALYVQASRNGTSVQVNGQPYSKSKDDYCNASGYDYTVTSSTSITHYYGNGSQTYWGTSSGLATVDLTVPEGSSGYVLILADSDAGMDIKLGSDPSMRTVATGIKPFSATAYMKYKYLSTDIVNGKVTLTLNDLGTDLKIYAIGIQAISPSAPAATTGLTKTSQTATTVSLSWGAVSGAWRYNVYRNGECVGVTTATAFTDTGVPAGRTHTYTVSAASLTQGEGNMSAGVNVIMGSLLVDENFNSMATGQAPTGGWTVTTAGGTVTVADIPSADDKSMKIYDNSASALVTALKSFTATSSNVKAEYKIRADQTTALDGFSLRDSFGTIGITVALDSNGYIYTYNGTTKTNVQTYFSNTWYYIKIDANPLTGKFDLYVNGVLRCDDYNFRNAVSNLSQVYINSGSTTTETSYYDDIKVYN